MNLESVPLGAKSLVGRLLVGLALLSCLLGLPLSGASAVNPACDFQTPNFSQKRVCQNATLNELDRKLSNLEQELDSGWGIPAFDAGDLWRSQVLPACRSDACLESAYRKRLSALDALPAFVCAGGLNQAERLVCRTPVLGSLDRALNRAYGVAQDASSDTLTVRAAQGRWLRGVRDGCATVACLTRAYQDRLRVLQQLTAQAEKRGKEEAAMPGSGQVKQFSLSSAQQRSIQAQMGADFADPSLNQGGCLKTASALLDLNRDGHADPVFTSCSGAHNEQAYFFLWERGTYRLLLTDSVGYFGYQLQDTRTHGLPVIRLITHSSCCEHPSAYYGYDGRVYRTVACFDERFLREDFYVFQYSRPSGLYC